MEYDHIILEKKDGIARITINRPDALNALHPDTHRQLQDALVNIDVDPEVKVVIITGAGKTFSSGADLKVISTMIGKPQEIVGYGQMFHNTTYIIEHLTKVVIAMINGLCLAGGIEVMEACDLAYASEDARIGDQHANFGLVPTGGGSQRLPRLIGLRKAKELLFTGDWLTGKEAEEVGLINKAVPADKLEETVMEVARKLTERSVVASKWIKYAVNRGMQVDLYAGIELEKSASNFHFCSEDSTEGITAFLEKRKPNFPGR
ncbi:MAG: enoyl-CoA hydratase/isomerase family protein [Chloroflexi bacterium]|nr:enoyl-CoA hydratase/isomerase family protein [Chloroflexota bacterium]